MVHSVKILLELLLSCLLVPSSVTSFILPGGHTNRHHIFLHSREAAKPRAVLRLQQQQQSSSSGGSNLTKSTPTATTSAAMTPHDHFQATVRRLRRRRRRQEQRLDEGSNQTILLINDDDRDDEENVVLINSLVFQIDNSADYVLAVLSSDDRVNVSALQELLWEATTEREGQQQQQQQQHQSTLQLGSNPRILCGFDPGTIPPLGLMSPPLVLTVVEKSLLDNKTKQQARLPIQGGGGVFGVSCRLSLDLLLEQPNVQLGSFREEVISSVGVNGNHPRPPVLPKPFFAMEPPDIQLATTILQQDDDDDDDDDKAENPLQPASVSVVGRVSGVRRMAKLLIFADLAPLQQPQPCDDDNDDDHPWRSPLTGNDMAVQLILGKTVVQNLGGEAPGAVALRSLKPGQLILVQGQTNVQNRDSLHNWVTKRSLDIVVHSFQILLQQEQQQESGGLAVPTTHPTSSSKSPSSVLGKRALWRPTPGLSYLTLKELYPQSKNHTKEHVVWVDSMESVHRFSKDLSQLLMSLTTGEDEMDDGVFRTGLVGIDCEWLPSFYLESSSQPQPVLLLQISLHSLEKVYLLDMQSLVRPLLPAVEPRNALEDAVATTLGDLLECKRLIKVGFQLAHDLQQLAASYPHMKVFQTVHSVLEASAVAKKVMHIRKKERNARMATSSLSRLTETFLGKGIAKDQQCSDWSLRPLTSQQIEYAALDAVVTPVIVSKLLKAIDAQFFAEPQLGRWEGDNVFDNAILSWRFVFLEDTTNVRAIRKLNAKRVVGNPFIVSQKWVTGQDPPLLPFFPPDGEKKPYTDRDGIVRYPSNIVSLDHASFHRLMDAMVGDYVGRSKERCITPFLTESALPLPARLDFPQRSGFVEMDNAFFLFVNMPKNRGGRGQPRSYPNEWLQDGQVLTWFLRESEWKRGSSPLAQKLQATEDAAKPTVISLFVRVGKEPFLCCGRCRVVHLPNHAANNEEQEWNLVTLHLMLLDWARLHQSSQDFRDLIQAF